LQLIDAEKYAEAEPLTERLVQEYPLDGHNWLLLARTARHLGRYKQAADAYQRAIPLLGPGVPGKARYWLAVSEVGNGHPSEALDALYQLVENDHFVDRPSPFNDPNLAPLKKYRRFAEIAGHYDSSSWSRDEGWRHDIDYLFSEMRRVNPDYHNHPFPRLFQQTYRNLRAEVPRLSDEQIYVGMSRLLSTLNQGHTNLWPFIPAVRMKFKVLPLQFYIFPEGVFIVSSDADNKDLMVRNCLPLKEPRQRRYSDGFEVFTLTIAGWRYCGLV
jgi:tetratricopeptide (TPR) repeat protein